MGRMGQMGPMGEQVFVVVPAYNEGAAVYGVIAELVAHYPNVVVVDDGSGDATAEEAKRAGAKVVRHALNRGQGAALQTGIEYALRRNAEVIVTFDADGQHRVEDIAALVHALEQTNADVAIGSRFLHDIAAKEHGQRTTDNGQRSTIPPLRRFTLRLAVRFMRLTSGVALTDAHNGLRAFRRDAARKIRITLDGMAHASELVDQISEHGLRVTEVPVVIRYSEYSMNKGQSSAAAFRIAFDYLIQRWFR
ncbi:MAG TPA: glycosyltransferase family 2 protein [Thermoanaerobaculia bacterium]